VNGPKVVVVPSGSVTFTVIPCHLSPYSALAVGGGSLTQKLSRAVWPMPIGLGETLMKEYVGYGLAAVCALALGNSIIEADIEIMKSIEIRIAIALFFSICIFHSFL
jgi:hypothetical protein